MVLSMLYVQQMHKESSNSYDVEALGDEIEASDTEALDSESNALRQIGQESCCLSQGTTQSVWNR
jgi:hypothetical protein